MSYGILGGLADGFVRGVGMGQRLKESDREAKEREEDRADRKADREFQAAERRRMVSMREALGQAAQPVVPVSGEVYQPQVDDDGLAMPANPTMGSLKVGDQRFTDPVQAQQAAAAQNTPDAQMARMSDVAMRHGDPVAGMQLRNSARQGQLADLQLTEAKGAAERNEFQRKIGKAIITGGWAGLPDLYKNYSDGMDIEVQEDGKGGATVTRFKDGKPLGSQQFSDLSQVFEAFAAQADPSLWREGESKRAETKRVQGNADREFALREKSEARTAAYQQGMLGLARSKAAGQGGATEVQTAESTFDAKTAADIAKDTVKGEVEAALQQGKPMSPEAIAQRTDSVYQALFAAHGNSFIANNAKRVLTMVQADPQAYAGEYKKALALGLPRETLEGMGFKAPGGKPKDSPSTTDPAAPAASTGRAQQSALAAPPMATMRSRVPAPEGSRQAAWEASQERARQEIAARQAAASQKVAAQQQAFEQDAASLAPLDLIRKYQDFGARGQLTREQLARLKQAELQVR